MTSGLVEKTPLFYARVVGFGLLLMAILAIFANFFVFERMIVAGDAAATIANITADELLFRFGILSFVLVLILDVIVAWALYILLKRVNRNMAMLAALFRLFYTAIFAAAIFNFLSVLQLIRGQSYLGILETNQLHVQVLTLIDAFNNGWIIGLVFFGIHLLIIGYLVLNSEFMPKFIGVFLIVAGMGYLIDNFAKITMLNYADYEIIFILIVAIPGAVAELTLAVWLLAKGRKIPEIIPLEPSFEGRVH